MKILLKGYYNAGNFGDDLLMISASKIIREVFPGSELWIAHGNKMPLYSDRLVSDAHFISFEEIQPRDFDLIVFGGGGIFFGFRKKSLKWLLLNGFYKVFKKIPVWEEKIKNFHSVPTIGIGIGIGPYHRQSASFIPHTVQLKNFRYLSVRDKKSYSIIKAYHSRVKLHSDLVFSPLIKSLFDVKKQNKTGVGIIFRDWIYGDNRLEELVALKKRLEARGKPVRFISYNPVNDMKGLDFLENLGLNVLKYNPLKMNDFINELSRFEWIISQRAHGMIVAHLMKIPAIGIELEPKLKNIHRILPLSTRLVHLNEINKIPDLISSTSVNENDFSLDKEKNENKILELISDLKRHFLNK